MSHTLEQRLSAQTHAGRLLTMLFSEQPRCRRAGYYAELLECLSETEGELADRLREEEEK